MVSAGELFRAQASALLEKTDIIASTPHPLEALVNPLVAQSSPGQPASVSMRLRIGINAQSNRCDVGDRLAPEATAIGGAAWVATAVSTTALAERPHPRDDAISRADQEA